MRLSSKKMNYVLILLALVALGAILFICSQTFAW